MKEFYNKIKKYILENKDEMIELWKNIVNIDSGSENIIGVKKVSSILKNKMESFGIDAKEIITNNSSPLLIGEWNTKNNKDIIIFIGHMDTVFVEGTAEKNPFRIDDMEKVFGPGVYDMKGGLVIALYVIKALQKFSINNYGIKIIFTADEENLHMHSNQKELIIKEAKIGKYALNFESGSLEEKLILERKGGGTLELMVKGTPAHSGVAPEKGRSAILEMAHKIIEIESKNNIIEGKLINCGKIIGGTGENVIPEDCKINIGIRFSSIKTRDEILNDLSYIVNKSYIEGTKTNLKIKTIMDCMEKNKENLLFFEKIKKIAKDCGYGNLELGSTSGVSDSGITSSIGIPTICSCGVKGSNAHTNNEFALLDSLFERTALFATVISKLK